MRKLLTWLGFHIHDWSKWEKSGELVRIEPKYDNSVVGYSQERRCITCGKYQSERVLTIL